MRYLDTKKIADAMERVSQIEESAEFQKILKELHDESDKVTRIKRMASMFTRKNFRECGIPLPEGVTPVSEIISEETLDLSSGTTEAKGKIKGRFCISYHVGWPIFTIAKINFKCWTYTIDIDVNPDFP
jgi:hypothetical protein